MRNTIRRPKLLRLKHKGRRTNRKTYLGRAKTKILKRRRFLQKTTLKGGDPPVLADDNFNEEEFFKYFDRFLSKCEDSAEVEAIFGSSDSKSKVLCERFGLNMLQKVSIIKGIWELYTAGLDKTQSDETDKPKLTITDINNISSHLENNTCDKVDDTNNSNTVVIRYKDDIITMLSKIFNEKNINQINNEINNEIVSKNFLNINIDSTDAEAQASNMKKLLETYWFGDKKDEKCKISKHIIMLLKILYAIQITIEKTEEKCEEYSYLCKLREKVNSMIQTKIDDFIDGNTLFGGSNEDIITVAEPKFDNENLQNIDKIDIGKIIKYGMDLVNRTPLIENIKNLNDRLTEMSNAYKENRNINNVSISVSALVTIGGIIALAAGSTATVALIATGVGAGIFVLCAVIGYFGYREYKKHKAKKEAAINKVKADGNIKYEENIGNFLNNLYTYEQKWYFQVHCISDDILNKHTSLIIFLLNIHIYLGDKNITFFMTNNSLFKSLLNEEDKEKKKMILIYHLITLYKAWFGKTINLTKDENDIYIEIQKYKDTTEHKLIAYFFVNGMQYNNDNIKFMQDTLEKTGFTLKYSNTMHNWYLDRDTRSWLIKGPDDNINMSESTA